MVQLISLHGGPMHGQKTAVPDGRDHFHVIQPDTSALSERDVTEPTDDITEIPTKEGTYSRVRNTDDFEWDGWRTHD